MEDLSFATMRSLPKCSGVKSKELSGCNGSALGGKWRHGASGEVVATSTNVVERQLLEHEAIVLEHVGSNIAPRLVRVARTSEVVQLTRAYVPGLTLGELPLSEWSQSRHLFQKERRRRHHNLRGCS